MWVTDFLIIYRELSNIEEKELIRDSVSTRTICCFIQDLAKLLPAEILPHVSLLMSRMDEEVRCLCIKAMFDSTYFLICFIFH